MPGEFHNGIERLRQRDLGFISSKPFYAKEQENVVWAEFPSVLPDRYPEGAYVTNDFRSLVPISISTFDNSGIDVSVADSEKGHTVYFWADITTYPDTLEGIRPDHLIPSEYDRELEDGWAASDGDIEQPDGTIVNN